MLWSISVTMVDMASSRMLSNRENIVWGGCTQPPIFVGKNILENDKKYLTKQEKSARIRKRSTKAGQKPELEKKFAKT